ncbi:acyl carrier protein [Spongiimicrobium salis]|uniref:acyl carrier protein n=1 Tax=Spongiimicrobium salis TaxID=1667022 RepID=UPI00374D3F5B
MDKIIKDYIINEVATERLTHIDVKEELLGSGIVNSMGMMRIVLFIEKQFQVKVPPEDMTLDNFRNIQKITEYITSKKA